MIPNTRLDELAAMEQAATDAPWFAVESDDDFFMTQYFVSSVCEGDEPDEIVAGTLIQNCKQVHDASKKWQENAAFIAASRNEFAAMVEQCREANRLRKNMTFIREGLSAWLDNAQHNRQRMDKELIVGCLERLIVDADQALKGPT